MIATIHHRKPKSLGGKREPRNVTLLSPKQHDAWHTLFENMTPEQIAEVINAKYLDPDFQFVVRRKD